jgi:hypothetical protein
LRPAAGRRLPPPSLREALDWSFANPAEILSQLHHNFSELVAISATGRAGAAKSQEIATSWSDRDQNGEIMMKM